MDPIHVHLRVVVVFLATLKFINMLKFNRRMGMLTDTIKLAAKDMKAFVITFFIYFFAFSQLAYLLFGSVLTAYSSFVNTIESLFSVALGDFDFNALCVAQPILGPVFLLDLRAFLLVVLGLPCSWTAGPFYTMVCSIVYFFLRVGTWITTFFVSPAGPWSCLLLPVYRHHLHRNADHVPGDHLRGL